MFAEEQIKAISGAIRQVCEAYLYRELADEGLPLTFPIPIPHEPATTSDAAIQDPYSHLNHNNRIFLSNLLLLEGLVSTCPTNEEQQSLDNWKTAISHVREALLALKPNPIITSRCFCLFNREKDLYKDLLDSIENIAEAQVDNPKAITTEIQRAANAIYQHYVSKCTFWDDSTPSDKQRLPRALANFAASQHVLMQPFPAGSAQALAVANIKNRQDPQRERTQSNSM